MIYFIYNNVDYIDQYLWEQGMEQIATCTLLIFGIFIIWYFIKLYFSSHNGKKGENIIEKDKNKEISDEELCKILDGYRVETLKEMACERFIAIMNAIELFDYDQLRKLCSEALYQLYVTELDLLKNKKEKHIIGGFKNNGINLIDIDDNGKLYTFKFMVNFQYYDYVVKDKVKEEDFSEIGYYHHYILEFILNKEIQDSIKCPNCGASMKVVTSKKCEYCGSLLSAKANDFVLSKITDI